MSTSTAMRGRLAEIVRSPLIAPYNTLQTLRPDRLGSGVVYFGTGLAKPNAFTTGLPFDYLLMLTSAELIRRATGSTRIIQEISDVHCIPNQVASETDIAAMARYQQRQVVTLARNIGMEGRFECLLASEYQQDPAYARCKREVDERSNEQSASYFNHQWAGDSFMWQEQGVTIKLGWLTDDSKQPQGRDERFFNQGYQRLGLPGPAYAYTWCGWNWNAQNPRVSPYTRVAGENRPLLEFRENTIVTITGNINDPCTNAKTTASALGNMAMLVTQFEEILGPVNGESIWRDEEADPEEGRMDIPGNCGWVNGRSYDLPTLCGKADAIRKLCL